MRKHVTRSNPLSATTTPGLCNAPHSAQSVAVSPLHKAETMLALAAVLCIGFASTACETSHTESDTPRLFGGNTHEETTTTHNPVTGTNDTSHTESKTP